ncbi:MAG: c-type cytochrome biogenesis protein CcsB [Deltaproteobacteria bacterium]|nr:c-type cytochrome biogenesis protein CcsB [Deltaproteobacteria bacterium]
MANILSVIAFLLIILSSGGYIVYIVKQEKKTFTWSRIIFIGGFVFHTLSLGCQFYNMGAVPVITLKSTLPFLAWFIMGAYLAFQIRFGLMVLGSFVAPLTAILMIISWAIPGEIMVVNPILKSSWLVIHVGSMFIGDGIFTITFLSAIMYLIQEDQIKKKKRGSFYSRLPSLETLDAINHYSIIYGFPFLTLGMITGAIYAQHAIGGYWRWDPKEVWSLITWLSYAILLHERLAVGWRGRRAAWMSIFCFIILIFTFVFGSVWLSDYHTFSHLGGLAGP